MLWSVTEEGGGPCSQLLSTLEKSKNTTFPPALGGRGLCCYNNYYYYGGFMLYFPGRHIWKL